MFFLGVPISKVNRVEALVKVSEFLSSSGQYKIFTPNPEMMVKAQKDDYFKQVLRVGDLNLCDGIGLQMFTGIKRIPGVDFMLDICGFASEQGKSVYLLGSGSEEVVQKTAAQLRQKFSNIIIAGVDRGMEIRDALHPGDLRVSDEMVVRINQIKPDILFVAFGMGKQEKWIYENLSSMPSVKIAMGVGGSFDFISGAIPRAPLFLRTLGLEWVYRLIRQPQRIGRIFNATIVFLFYIWLKKK